MTRRHLLMGCLLGLAFALPSAADDMSPVKMITIRAPRDMGYFAGDLVKADVDIVVDDNYRLEDPSLPHPGPINYWLDLRKIGVSSRGSDGATRGYTLHVLYQNFYDALDARPQEIPAFPLTFSNGRHKVSAHVPAWTIGVSSLREIAPPIKDDPKDYLRADERAPYVRADPFWWSVAGTAVAMALALALLAHDRAWWPFRRRPARVFTDAARKLPSLARSSESLDAYAEALLVLHRGIDHMDGRRVLADDMPAFLDRHPMFAQQREGFARFFAASRSAFFGSDPKRALTSFDFDALQTFARQLAAIERTKP